jgi:hypothetical protein
MLDDHRNFTRPAEVVTATLPSVALAPVQHADILELSACALSELITSREVSCVEVMRGREERRHARKMLCLPAASERFRRVDF